MNRAIGKEWAADLRAGPPQAKEVLFDGRGHCCLGRLCVLAGMPEILLRKVSLPSHLIMDWAGMKTRSGRYRGGSLVKDNDSGKTFAEIADIIERFIALDEGRQERALHLDIMRRLAKIIHLCRPFSAAHTCARFLGARPSAFPTARRDPAKHARATE